MKKILYIPSIMLVLLLSACSLKENSTQAIYSTLNIPQALSEIYYKKADAFLKDSYAPGVQIAILLPNNTVYSFARGLANINTKERLNTDHMLIFGSVTKIITAFRMNKLYEQGLLKKQDNIQKYLNTLPPTAAHKANINPEQLITHSSGLKELFTIPDLTDHLSEPYTQEQIVQIIFNQDLIFQPGTNQKYNNSGFIVADLLIKKIYDTNPNKKLSTQEILESIGVDNVHSMYPPKSEIKEQIPVGYTLKNEKEIILPTNVIYPTFSVGSGDYLGKAKNIVFLENSLSTLLPTYYADKNTTFKKTDTRSNTTFKKTDIRSNTTFKKTDTRSIEQSPIKMHPLLPEQYQSIPIFPPTLVKWDSMEYNNYLLAGINMLHWADGSVHFGKDGMFPGFSMQFLHDPESDITIAVLSNQEFACMDALLLAKELIEATAKSLQ